VAGEVSNRSEIRSACQCHVSVHVWRVANPVVCLAQLDDKDVHVWIIC